MLFIEACFSFPFAHSLIIFKVSLFSCYYLKFYISIYNCLHIKKGRLAIRVQIPLTLLGLLLTLCKGRGSKFILPFQDFLFMCIIVMFLQFSRTHALPPTTDETQRAPLSG